MTSKFKYSKQQIIESANRYTSIKDWFTNECGAYQSAKRQGFFDECIGHMKRPSTITKWTDANIQSAILSCDDTYTFKRKYLSLYTYLSKMGILIKWLKLIPKKDFRKHTDQECVAVISQYKTVGEFRSKNRQFYNYIINSKRHNLLTTLDREKMPNGTLNYEYCKDVASKCINYYDFRKNHNSVYLTSLRSGFLKEITSQLTRQSESSFETSMNTFLTSISNDIDKQYAVYKEINDKRRVNRFDFLINKCLFIECNGLYWHSEDKKGKTYHADRIKESNYPIIQIYSDEWEFKQDIVKSIIKAKLGMSDFRYYARKLEMKDVPSEEAQEFLKTNHLMGEFRSAKHIGLYAQDKLVSLISYKKHKEGIDISRFCNALNSSVAGGLSKLLKEIERRETPKFIQSWVDLRYGTGDSLKSIGFTHSKTTLGWKWTDGINTFNRLKCRANMDSRRLTEKQHAEELGWYRIYDAGQALYMKELKTQ